MPDKICEVWDDETIEIDDEVECDDSDECNNFKIPYINTMF
jgi:hypothetical protein